MGLLGDRGLDPRLADATDVVTRFELGTGDAAAARQVMDGLTRPDDTPLIWTVVPPGGPAYLLSHLIVEGPDGRPFLFTDIPAATTGADVAADALEEYPREAPVTRPRHAVAQRVAANGQGKQASIGSRTCTTLGCTTAFGAGLGWFRKRWGDRRGLGATRRWPEQLRYEMEA